MQIGALLRSLIYLVSSALLYPVLVLLSVLTLWVLVRAGAFFAEWLERSRLEEVPIDKSTSLISRDTIEGLYSHRVRNFHKNLRAIILSGREMVGLEVERLLQERSLSLWKSLDGLQMVIRIGPGLGLIGTLIPMGTGLAALGQGDIGRLSSDLVVAFTTTVVGMAEGMLAYFFYTMKKRWVEQDIRDIEFVTEVLMNSKKESAGDGIHETKKSHQERPGG